jgi:hypothetical protein
MFAQVNDEGQQFALIHKIVDHQKDNTAVPLSEEMVHSANGMEKPKVMMRGWEFMIQFKDGSLGWSKLKDLKESNPIKVAEYVVAN